MNTPLSTRLLTDINPGPGDSSISELISVGNGQAFFGADDGTTGLALWSTDGANTALVKDVNTNGNADIDQLTRLSAGRALFVATDSNNDRELWISDGTEAGTTRVLDLTKGRRGSNISEITALGNGQALFFVRTGRRSQLWITDGSEAGTSLVSETKFNSANGEDAFALTVLSNGTALFRASEGGGSGQQLWATDGTSEGTRLLRDISLRSGNKPFSFGEFGDGSVLFKAREGTGGFELWITDGTEENTRLLKDINPGNASSNPERFTAIGEAQAVFSADDGKSGREVWITDGTEAGTRILKNISANVTSSNPSEFTAIASGSRVVFSAQNSVNGTELWATDGTRTGTSLIRNINSDAASSFPSNFAVVGSGALFSATDNTGAELWFTDGTSPGTQQVSDISLNSGSNPSDFAVLSNNQVVFAADDGENGRELFLTTGNFGSAGGGLGSGRDGNPNEPSDSEEDTDSPLSLTPIGDGQILAVKDVSESQFLTFEIDRSSLSKASDLSVFSVGEDGGKTEIYGLSLLEVGPLGSRFAQVGTLARQFLDDGAQLQFELNTDGGTQIGTFTAAESGEVDLDFARGVSLNLRLQDSVANDLIGGVAGIENLLDSEASSIDITQFDGQNIAMSFSVYRDAKLNNTVGLYRTVDAAGGVLDPVTGRVISVGEVGYQEAAIAQRIEVNLTGQNQQLQQFDTQLTGGGYLGLFLVVDGIDPTTNPVLFGSASLNPDALDHAKFLGSNTFGFEDSVALGDEDFNDVVVRFNVATV